MSTYLASIDLKGSETERPFMLLFTEGADEESARVAAEARLDEREVVRSVEPLQAILDDVLAKVAEGGRYSVGFKYEDGSHGPVWITDLAAFEAAAERHESGALVLSVPFGSRTPGQIELPWMSLREARRLAKYLGLTVEES